MVTPVNLVSSRRASDALFPELASGNLLARWAAADASAAGSASPPTNLFQSLSGAVDLNHRFNALLWLHEDRVRSRSAPDRVIVEHKQAIDRCNRERNRSIEAIDELISQRLRSVPLAANARRNSETPGSILDRLSIASLRIRHLEGHLRKLDTDDGRRASWLSRVELIARQRQDLLSCLEKLLEELALGLGELRLFKQCKMYDDPQFNAHLLGEPHGARDEGG